MDGQLHYLTATTTQDTTIFMITVLAAGRLLIISDYCNKNQEFQVSFN